MDKTDLFIEYCKSLGGIPDRPHSTGYIRKKQINTTATFLYHVIAGCKGRKKSGSFGTLAIKMKRFFPENVICMRQLGPLVGVIGQCLPSARLEKDIGPEKERPSGPMGLQGDACLHKKKRCLVRSADRRNRRRSRRHRADAPSWPNCSCSWQSCTRRST